MTGIDLTSGQIALAGCVATMDDVGTVIRRGVVYVRDDTIVQVSEHDAPVPDGFGDVPIVDSGGTLFPGLIELHNHLPYDVLPLWQVPKKFTNRDQWSSSATKDYHRLISGPMGVLGRNPDIVPAVVRYVEVRAMLGGTTTSQGVALAVDPGIVKLYRGLVRNVEATGDPALPVASTRIADVDATDAERFLARISGSQKLLLHLSEGTDTKARQHFLALKMSDQRWAITPQSDRHPLRRDSPQPTSPSSPPTGVRWCGRRCRNLLLYGQTANLAAALSAGVPVALGSDWAPSGSRNLLAELKIARLAAPLAGADLSDRDLVTMATRTPAKLLGWDQAVGSLEPGKRADLIVVHGKTGDPYSRLLAADEADLDLVMINGIVRSGSTNLTRKLQVTGERVRVGTTTRSSTSPRPTRTRPSPLSPSPTPSTCSPPHSPTCRMRSPLHPPGSLQPVTVIGHCWLSRGSSTTG